MINNPTMRMEHKAGDKMFVNYTGDKLWIYPPGESFHQVDVFVAILGCSLFTCVEAVDKQTKEDFISACENAFYLYAVFLAVVPEQSVKTASQRYQFTGAVLAVDTEDIGKGGAAGKVAATVVKIRVTSSTNEEIKASSIIHF